jgi:hypothetical protein
MESWDMFCRASAAWSVAALAAFELRVLGPLVQPGRMTCCHDSMSHLWRAVQLDGLVGQGVWWPRGLPALALGYDYPLFNFYPALFASLADFASFGPVPVARLESLHGLALCAGMYDMMNGQRLPAASGGDVVELGCVQV